MVVTLCLTISKVDADSSASRPPLGDFEQRAEQLFEAIKKDDISLAKEVFFPREPFLKLKGIADPGAYYDRLAKRFEKDVHALHAGISKNADAKFLRFELSRRGGWVMPGEEANRLPYWASRYSKLYYGVQRQQKAIEVRVLITWEDRWYVIHLSEFK